MMLMTTGGWGGDQTEVEMISLTAGTVDIDSVEPLPVGRRGHTFNNGIICGGGSSTSGTRNNCIKLAQGTWPHGNMYYGAWRLKQAR